MREIKTDHYLIVSTDTSVQAFSQKQIPFEPKGWQKEFRTDLRNALAELKPAAGQCLIGRYSTREHYFFDVENVLFYNIGASAFRYLNVDELRIQAVPDEDMFTELFCNQFLHAYSYQMIEPARSGELFLEEKIAARWQPISVSGFSGNRKAAEYWLAMKENSEKIDQYHTIPQDREFGIEIKLSVPEREHINLTGVIKPLLDGSICALHCGNAELRKNADILASKLGIGKEYLLDRTQNVLGENDFLRLHGEGVKWNPRDDKCTSIRIVLERNQEKIHRFAGAIYEVD